MHTGDNTEQIWAHWFSQSQKRLQLGEGGGDQGDALVWGEAPNFFGYKTS